MQNKKQLIFVEVRYRKNANYGSALDSVNLSKQQKIIAAAQYYLMKNLQHRSKPIRFDVVGITGNKVQWVENAFC